MSSYKKNSRQKTDLPVRNRGKMRQTRKGGGGASRSPDPCLLQVHGEAPTRPVATMNTGWPNSYSKQDRYDLFG